MGKIKSVTPKAKKPESELTDSSKKLKQARLPFKILEPSPKAATPPADAAKVQENDVPDKEKQKSLEARKRKLSYDDNDCEKGVELDAGCKENLNEGVSKKTKSSDVEMKVDEVIMLEDSDVETEQGKKKEIVDSPKTPQLKGKQHKGQGAGTPASGNKEKTKETTPKVTIKLPLSSGKNKRTKTQRKSTTQKKSNDKKDAAKETVEIDSSSDDTMTEKLNPHKRARTEELPEKNDTNEEIYEVESNDAEKEQAKESPTEKEKKSNQCETEIEAIGDSKTEVKQLRKSPRKKVTKSADVSVKDSDKKYVKDCEKNSEKESDSKVGKGFGKVAGKNSENGSQKTEKDSNKVPEKKSEKESDKKPQKACEKSPEKESDEKSNENSVKFSEATRNNTVVVATGGDRGAVEVTPTKKSKAGSPQLTPKSVLKASAEKNMLESEADSSKSTPVKSGITTTDANDKPTTDMETNNESDVQSSSDSVQVITNDAENIKTSSKKVENEGGSLSAISKKNLTPKQLKLMEQRRQAREEKERKLQEERMEKQRKKEEQEQERKKQREEKEQQRRKERDEREEVKRKEREDKERKRLAELEVKNEEKRKKNEAREEELRKKEEERKRKEQEKEDQEMRKKKEAAAFSKFFLAKSRRSTTDATQEQRLGERGDGEAAEALAFQPFQVKGDMKMAPICRKKLIDEELKNLDTSIQQEKEADKEDLYLAQLRAGKIIPGKWRRTSMDSKDADTDEVIIVEDALERAGQAIVEESHEPLERLRVKFYRFAENRRPPYYGTWRKRTEIVTPRKPFALDKKYFDYEVDSDDEWEEEEPGESLDGSDDEKEKEKESEDEDYEVDEWLVPHGHLSDEELQNNEEDGSANGALEGDQSREAQKAKLKILQQEFAQEMKKKTEKIKPRLIGCIWVDENGNQPELCPKIIWDTLNMRGMLYTAAPLVEEPEMPEKSESNSPNSNNADKASDKLKPIGLNDEMLKDLVRLVHGNRHSKQFLINEFIAYIESSESAIQNGDAKGPLKVVVREKIDDYADWKVIELDVPNKKKRKLKKFLCWVVNEDTLNKMGLEALTLSNKWQYTLQPKFVDADNELQQTELNQSVAETDGETEATYTPKHVKKPKLEITNFTKVLTTEEKEAQKLACTPTTSASKSKNPANKTGSTPVAKKRIKLLASGPLGKELTTEKEEQDKESAAPTVPEKPATTPGKPKKRVALLASGPLGQKLTAPAGNASISQFLKKASKEVGEKPKDVEMVLEKKEGKKQERKKKISGGKHAEPMEVDDIEDDVILID